MGFLDAYLPLIIVPALLLALFAQLLVHTTYVRASEIDVKISGYAAARHVLDGSGLYDVKIEQVPGHLSNHYDLGHKVLQLSPEVYHGRNIAALGIAAHEAGHAIQSARGFKLLALREISVPAATYGSGAGILLAVIGLICRFPPFLAFGILLFSGVVYFQILSLPVEFSASRHGRRMLADLGIVDSEELVHAGKVLNAAALTYVGATLQSILTLVHRLAGRIS